MPTPATQALVDAHWGKEFGVSPFFWNGAATKLAPRAGAADWLGLFVFRRGQAAVVQVPAALEREATRWVANRTAEVLMAPEFWARTLGDRLNRLVGPAWLGYADQTDALPAQEHGARRLDASDEPAMRLLAAAVGDTAWEHSGIAFGNDPIYGVFIDGELAVAGMVEIWGDHLGHVGVVAHPDQRGKGLARAVVALAVREGLARGQVMQYRTLASNLPSVAIAERLGFQAYASTLSVRLASPEETGT